MNQLKSIYNTCFPIIASNELDRTNCGLLWMRLLCLLKNYLKLWKNFFITYIPLIHTWFQYSSKVPLKVCCINLSPTLKKNFGNGHFCFMLTSLLHEVFALHSANGVRFMYIVTLYTLVITKQKNFFSQIKFSVIVLICSVLLLYDLELIWIIQLPDLTEPYLLSPRVIKIP